MAHKAAKALHQVDALHEVTMRDMDALCLPPAPAYTPTQIRRIRASTGMSQAVFARLMLVGKSAVAQWEQDGKKPKGSAMRLLEAFDPNTTDSPILAVRERQHARRHNQPEVP